MIGRTFVPKVPAVNKTPARPVAAIAAVSKGEGA